MGLMMFNFSDIGKNENLITSYNFYKLNSQIEKSTYFTKIRLADIFDIISGYAFKSEDYVDDGIKLLRIGDIYSNGKICFSDMVSLPEDYEEKYGKYLIKENDIVIAMTGATIGKVGLVPQIKESILLNQRVAVLRLKNSINADVKFIYYLLRHELFLKQVYVNSMGKSQPNISPFDILKLKIPQFDKEVQNKIMTKIKPIEDNIENLSKQIKKPLEIINKVFINEFQFDWEKFTHLKQQKQYNSSITEYGNNLDLRFSYKFHNRAGQFLWKFLNEKTSKKVKDYISESIVLGKGISPNEYDEEGEYYYIAMSNIKSWRFDKKECNRVGEEFYSSNLNKSVRKNDILLARSGEGTIGKVAIIESDEIEGIFADFTMRIRLKDYDVLCAYYYFRSDLFQYLVNTHKKGLGNNTNIFPSQIQDLPMPDFDKIKQEEIRDIIKMELDKQKEIEELTEQNEKLIDKIIEDIVKKNELVLP